MDKLVSVIIPVYKVEKYLNKCVDSVLSQTYKNLEIFLVDDGSPDNCPQMCDEYAKKDNRIKVIHKPNGGLSSARNAALDVCKGDYIAFVDSDDWIEPTYIEELYSAITKYDADISICGINYYTSELELIKNITYEYVDKDIYIENILDLFFSKNSLSHHAWAKLYKRDIFDGLRYPVGVNYEDTYVITDVIGNVKKGVSIVKKPLYNYLRYREGSITVGNDIKKLDWIYAKRKTLGDIPVNTGAYKFACQQLFYAYSLIYNRVYKNKELRKKLFKLFNEDYKKYKKFFPIRTKIRAFIFRYFNWLYKIIWIKG